MNSITPIIAALTVTALMPTVGLRAEEPKSNAKGPAAAATTGEKAKPYPLDFCIVSDEKFAGSDMKPFELVNDGQTIKLCCKSCLKDFNKDKKKYVAKLAAEVKKQEASKEAGKK